MSAYQSDDDRFLERLRSGKRRTRAELLDELRMFQKTDDVEVGHLGAEYVLLELIGDVEIAEAFLAVPRWYA